MVFRLGCPLLLAMLYLAPLRGEATWRFDFAPAPARPGTIAVAPAVPYDSDRGYGFEVGAAAPGSPGFFFSARVPEGNYVVTVTVGAANCPAATTIKAEVRRYMAGPIATAAGESRRVRFTVNVRTPNLPDGGTVRLKPREKTGEFWDWDDKLTLEFDGAGAAVRSIEIAPAGPRPTLYLCGDSTVCDQPYEPFASWGQMLTGFFGPDLAVANHAESGESLRSFIGERRLDKLDSVLRPGDYVFIQFGHNDQKERGPGVGAFTTYRRDLERLIADARARGAIPVLVTPVSRRTFGPDGRIQNSLGDFPAAVRATARAQGTALIDLNLLSTEVYEALGPEGTQRLFPIVHGQREGTHHDDFGAYEMAKCVVEGIRSAGLPIASFLRPDTPAFDPRRPDRESAFDLPPSPRFAEERPYGN